MRNLVLTGFMGTGKTRIGRILAENLSMPFVDMDRTLEQRLGKTVSQIFKDYGETFFREMERQVCFELSRKSGQIIATGGGALLPKANRQLFSKDSIFCLEAPFEILSERLSRNNKRPLAANAYELWIERQHTYKNIFHHVASWKDPAEVVAAKIQRLFGLDLIFQRPDEAFYPIEIRSGAIAELPRFIDWLSLKEARKIIILTNPEIAQLYENAIAAYDMILIPEGESNKNLQVVQSIYDQLLAKEVGRNDVLVAVGGGVVGDITGFVAATYMRGLTYIQVPTSLLAMVDSSVGGKTGVDLPQGKNLIGAFKEPVGVLIDPDCLKTLPEAEMRCGLAEIVKHAIIGDPDLFAYLESGGRDMELLIRRSLAVKNKIVREDPTEQHRRMLLNLGHTFGHAIELLSNYAIRHGEAVSIGLVQACEYAAEQRLCRIELSRRVRALLMQLGLPVDLPNFISQTHMWNAMKHDKKRQAQSLRLILPYDLGDVRVFNKSLALTNP